MQWRDQLWLQQRMREDTQALPSDTCGWLISSFHSLLVMLRSLQTAVLRYREMASATMFRHGARGSSSYVSPLFFFVCVDSTWTYETTHKKPTSPGINRGPLRAVSSASNRIDLARELAASSCSSALSSHRPSGPRIQEISLGPSSQHFLKPSTFDLADGRYIQTRIAFHVQPRPLVGGGGGGGKAILVLLPGRSSARIHLLVPASCFAFLGMHHAKNVSLRRGLGVVLLGSLAGV
ncbi:uncharacterized protein LOC142768843 isoform X2 [Rhipicephalus microplus]|uniref:uncharacterized protein LOC142768843 isoform X2 n=1 Tax=Rhipicephalus microplus TaxID=6941 RepID=UPI003F6AF0F1